VTPHSKNARMTEGADAVQRLPVQHRKHPHCPSCGRQLDVFDHLGMTIRGIMSIKILKVTLQIECECGSQWCISTEPS
jgi:transposase